MRINAVDAAAVALFAAIVSGVSSLSRGDENEPDKAFLTRSSVPPTAALHATMASRPAPAKYLHRLSVERQHHGQLLTRPILAGEGPA